MKNKKLMFALLLLGFATSSEASTILETFEKQRTSIEVAYRSGLINYSAALDLMKEQAMIDEYFQKANEDGSISSREHTKIIKWQKRAARKIENASYNYAQRFNNVELPQENCNWEIERVWPIVDCLELAQPCTPRISTPTSSAPQPQVIKKQ